MSKEKLENVRETIEYTLLITYNSSKSPIVFAATKRSVTVWLAQLFSVKFTVSSEIRGFCMGGRSTLTEVKSKSVNT